jgi:hypothetical protein
MAYPGFVSMFTSVSTSDKWTRWTEIKTTVLMLSVNGCRTGTGAESLNAMKILLVATSMIQVSVDGQRDVLVKVVVLVNRMRALTRIMLGAWV